MEKRSNEKLWDETIINALKRNDLDFFNEDDINQPIEDGIIEKNKKFAKIIKYVLTFQRDVLDEIINYCESEIEKAMLLALIIAAREKGIQTIIEREDHNCYGDLRDGLDKLKIEIQKEMGEYRVDFLVNYSSLMVRRKKSFDDNDFEPQTFTERVVVECDGHEYHDKTKEQASADKRRDRNLLKLGYKVLRYSGSDIWRDCFKCASEVIDYLINAVEKQGEKLSFRLV